MQNMHQEKKNDYGDFFIFVHKNVYRIGFQKIKIRPWEDFELWPFSHFSSLENNFPVVKSGFWGIISQKLGVYLY